MSLKIHYNIVNWFSNKGEKMDITCKNCKKTFDANVLEVASATVDYNLGRTHTFKCDHCKTGNTFTKAEFETIKAGVSAPAAAATPAAAPRPVAKPVAAASKPMGQPMPGREMAKDDSAKPAAPMAAAASREGTVLVASLHVRKDHSTTSETVAGLVKGNKVKILGTWTDGTNTWAQIAPDQWAAIEYGGKKMIELA